MKIFYHGADFDGYCSGAIVYHKFKNALEETELELIPVDYHLEFPWESIKKGEEVVLVDFSLQPFEDMERLNSMVNLTWIDHHKTAIEQAATRGFQANNGQTLQLSKAACELAWEKYYGTSAPMPDPVRWLGRYDVWDHADPNVLKFQYGIRTMISGPDNILWSELLDPQKRNGELEKEILKIGEAILSYESGNNTRYAKNFAHTVVFEGRKFLAVNRLMTNSKIVDSLWDASKYDAVMVYGYMGHKWKVSLYANDSKVDVSPIAKKYGGGGHAGACGFTVDTLVFYQRNGITWMSKG